ncbi:MAG: hypothetical protein WCH43_02010 [Verrucomicrobiota bacterium]
MQKLQPATRIRTCRACGKQFEYPIKGSKATRHHCEECVNIPHGIRTIMERLSARIHSLELKLKQAVPKQ